MLIRAIASITISWYFCGFVLVLRTGLNLTFGWFFVTVFDL